MIETRRISTIRRHLASSSSEGPPTIPSCKIGDLLSDLPTPSLLLELSLAEKAVARRSDDDDDDDDEHDDDAALDQTLANDSNLDCLEGALFVHTQVVDTSTRDAINQQQGSGSSIVIGELDVPYSSLEKGAVLGIGLANHHVGGYYWARGMGIGASLPAHGIEVRSSSNESRSELYWLKRGPGLNAQETTEESSNSNDGKRSEWADFLVAGDTVQLVPKATSALLVPSSSSRAKGSFATLIGVRRIGRPLGADPIVEKVWIRSEAGGWVVPT
ncbi:unnamed protein product [Cylindrotheca closterium]|uniref:Uncharacterized protein n=1 Tax=Cylindrotheca closterium TaxID=2856 RepID=A0AAD2CUG0_9STRA|nr:unnamed protein product [Cylindrotheca closterium]